MMTRKFLWFWLIVASVAIAAPKMPVGEMFSATWCGPCATTAEYIDEHYPPLEPTVVLIRYETDSPFDTYDEDGIRDRVSTYFSGTYYIPHFFADGEDMGSGAGVASTWLSVLESRAGTEAPVSIEFTELTVDSVEITVALDDPSYAGSYELNVFLIEDSIRYSAPSGQTIFNQTFRTTMTNSSSGDLITLDSSEPVVRKYAVPSNPDWEPMHCHIVAFVQDRSTHEILQGAKTPLYRPDYYFAVSPTSDIITSVSEDSTATFEATVFNQGRNDDEYMISTDINVPDGWSVSTYAGGEEFSGSTNLTVSSGGSDLIGATVNSNGIRGSGKIVFYISSPHITDVEDTVVFRFNAGADVLLVDDDAGASYEQWFMESFEHLGVVYYYYDHDALGSPTGDFLSQFSVVVWETGADYSTVIVATDMYALRSYLDGGGHLYFSSPELGYYVVEGSGTAFRSFYETYFKASYEGDAASTRDVVGVSGDPLGDGLSFSISGGDGADDQNYPDYISAQPDAHIFLDYSDGTHAGLWYSGDYKLVYTAFGFEGIASAADRDTLMARIINWLETPTAVDEKAAVPGGIDLSISPNPFNNACLIEVPADADLEITDISGRQVFVSPGENSGGVRTVLWNPGGLPGGIYMVRAREGARSVVKKVVYLK